MQPIMWGSGTTGPALVLFHCAGSGDEDSGNLPIYLDITNIRMIEQAQDGGSYVTLTGGLYAQLHESAPEVINRIKQDY